ncbi:hypothetical protein AB0N05_37620 [Nocardia sp. NPDC051030]|uniref:hypothetical protein n=1 Tax=Nocardia sp. NPDC051030 TaxID=3155162 RepID=UPI0034211E17
MSMLLTALDPNTTVLAGGGIIDWVNNKSTETQTAIRSVVTAACLGGIGFTAIASRFALSKCAGAILVAGLVLAAVFKITAIKDKVGDEFDDALSPGARPAVVQLVDRIP